MQTALLEEFAPHVLLQNASTLSEAFKTLQKQDFKDDVTLLYLQNLS